LAAAAQQDLILLVGELEVILFGEILLMLLLPQEEVAVEPLIHKIVPDFKKSHQLLEVLAEADVTDLCTTQIWGLL
jgi:hypothetical protein